MEEERKTRLEKMDTKSLNNYRFILQSIAGDIKLTEKNMKLLVNQNTLDLTPTLLSGTDTGAQERVHAASTVIEALNRIRQLIDTLP
jgi:hypothetical protein